MTRIAVLDDYQSVAAGCADWSSLPAEVVFFTERMSTVDERAARLADFDVVVAMRERTPFDAELLGRLPALRLLVTTGMVNAALDLAAARARGVVVCGAGGGASGATAELTWGLILALLRQIPAEQERLRAGGWQLGLGVDLAGRTLGVLGLGRLGTRVARVGRAFEMSVIAWSANLTDAVADAAGARRVERDELFSAADVLSIHTVLSARTRGLVGAAELALMKPSAVLVNTSRGPIVDPAALSAALHAGRLAGAALDVYDREPLPADDPLRTAPHTVLTPHIGFVTEATYRAWFGQVVEDIAAYLAGSPIRVLNGE